MADLPTGTSVRRVPHCSHWGAYTLLVDDDRVVGVEPFAGDPAPSPIIQSVRGWANPAKRILRSLVRKEWLRHREKSDGSERGNDDYLEIDWDTAWDLVSQEIERVRSTHGNSSIFAGSYGWTSCGRFHHANSQLRRMLNLAGGYTGHVDTYSVGAGQPILRHTLGNTAACEGSANSFENIADNTETLLVFGALSPRTAQNEAGGIAEHSLESHLRRIKERGIKIVLISPLSHDVPDWVDPEWLPIRPNTDTALMLALCGEVIKEGREDRAFLDRCCSGVEMFRDYLTGKTDGVAKDAAWAEWITGIDARTIRDLSRRLTHTRSMIAMSWALQRADHGEQPFWAAIALACVLGQVGLPGGGFGFGYGSLAGVGSLVSLARLPALPQGRKVIPDFIPVARISDLLENPGATFEYEGRTHVYPDTRLVYWAGGNPFHHHQDINRLRRAWAKPETIIVQEPVWTATAARADIVLAATTSIERNDIAASKRSSMLIAMHRAIDPIGDSRTDYDIVRGIAGRLGIESAFTEGGRTEMEWLEALYDDSRQDAKDRLGFAMPDFGEFWAKGFAPVPVRRDHTYLAEFRNSPEQYPLATESGRIVLGSRTLANLGYDDCLPHPAWIEPYEWLGHASARRGDLLHLISNQPNGKLHSQLDSEPVSAATKINGRQIASLNPADADRLGVDDGSAVRIWNARGQVLASAALDQGVRPGVVVLPTGSWYAPLDESGDALELAGNPNVLTNDKATSRFGQGCSAHTCLVSVEPIDARNMPCPSSSGAVPAHKIVVR